jgi:Glyoxalase/Bleomycin resistance protein/Dioxygenase superfamily
MPLLSFGQPANGVMQMSYVVKDIHAGMQDWIDKLHVGPWFLLEHFTGERPVYRGQQSTADVAIAMSFAGHMNIELIQPNDTTRQCIKRASKGRVTDFTTGESRARISMQTLSVTRRWGWILPSERAYLPAETSHTWWIRAVRCLGSSN